jgi:1,2-diacylglycerol-3-alpha-glucose alpha-1,2-galactosyltransferase
MAVKKIRVNMVSESDISVQGHGVHTAYAEIASALEKREDVTLIRGDFGNQTDCDVVHLHTIGTQTWRKLLQPGPAKVVSAHVVPASLVGSIILARYWLFLASWYMRWFYNRADKVLAVSGAVADTLHNDLGVSREKIEIFYNTIDMQRYVTTVDEKKAARKRLGFKATDFIVLGNGQVQPRKRLDVFVAMANAQPDIQFVWVGGIPFKHLGADYANMQRLMTSAPKNLKITGVIPHDEVSDYLAVADVFCLPAEQENHPMCVLEAASANLPIVLRDIPEYNDTFRGDVIMCLSVDDFIAAIVKLRTDNVFYNKQQQKTKRIADRFDSNVAAERLVKLYRQLV